MLLILRSPPGSLSPIPQGILVNSKQFIRNPLRYICKVDDNHYCIGFYCRFWIRLEYCSQVSSSKFEVHIKRIECVQRSFKWHLSYQIHKAKKLPSYRERLSYFNCGIEDCGWTIIVCSYIRLSVNPKENLFCSGW